MTNVVENGPTKEAKSNAAGFLAYFDDFENIYESLVGNNKQVVSVVAKEEFEYRDSDYMCGNDTDDVDYFQVRTRKLIQTSKLFCEANSIQVPMMNEEKVRRGYFLRRAPCITNAEFYHNFVSSIVDGMVKELVDRFSDNVCGLLLCTKALDTVKILSHLTWSSL